MKPSDADGLLDKSGNIVTSYAPDFSECVLPYCTWYQDDFLGAVRGMKAVEIGIYSVLLNEMYERGQPISTPPDRLARLCGTTKKTLLNALEILIEEGKIVRLETGLWNVRVQKIFVQRRKNSHSNSEAGKKSGEKRNEINAPSERALNAGSTDVQPNPEAQIRDIGGGGSAGAREPGPPPLQGEIQTEREILLDAIGADPISGMIGSGGVQLGRMSDMIAAKGWREDLGLSIDEVVSVIREVMAAKRDGPPSTFSYFNKAMQRYAGSKSGPRLAPINGGSSERDHRAGQFQGRNSGAGSSAGRAHESLVAAFVRSVPDEPGGGAGDP